MEKEIMIDTRKLCKSYTNGEVQQHVIKNMDYACKGVEEF